MCVVLALPGLALWLRLRLGPTNRNRQLADADDHDDDKDCTHIVTRFTWACAQTHTQTRTAIK